MKKISKKTLLKSWVRWSCGNLSSMSFQWLESFGFADSMAPVIKELYGENKEEEIAALKRHSVFYNTEPQIGSIVNGIVCGLEEERANGADIDDEVINSIKIGLMGPLAGIGDAMIPGLLVPLLLSISIGLAEGGNIIGPLFYIVSFISIVTLLNYYVFFSGYKLGTKSVDMITGDKAQRVRESFNLLGSIVVGGVAASYVNVTTPLEIATGNADSTVVINDVLNGIFPSLLSLIVVLFCWWLMTKKNVSALKVMLILILIALIGVAVGFF